MENLTYINSKSGISHIISFTETSHSPGKIVIRSDGRCIGKINKRSKFVFCDNYEIQKLVFDYIS